jgi:hypothetical protein
VTGIRKLEIGRKIILIATVSAATALIIAGAEGLVYDRLESRRALEASVRTLAGITADNVMAAVSFNDQKVATDTLNALQSDPDIALGCVYTLTGRLAEFRREGFGACPDIPGPEGIFYEDQRIYVVVPVVLNDGKRIGTLHLYATLEQLQTRLRRDLINAGFAIILAGIVAWVLSLRLQRWISRPLRGLMRTTEAVALTMPTLKHV